MKRILHVSKYYYPFRGGTEQIAQDCVNACKGSYRQMVICFNHGEDSKANRKDVVDGVKVIRAGVFATVASQGLSVSYKKLLKKTIHSFKPDIIVFHYSNPFVAHFLLPRIPASCKFIIFWHLDIVRQKVLGRLFAGQNLRLLKRADLLIAASPNYVEGSPWLSRARDKCVVIPDCINVDRLKLTLEAEKRAARIREENKGKTICFAVGRHTAYKGFMYLIRAARLLDDSFQFFITGKGEETPRLKAEAAGDPKIHFLGLVDDEELKAYLTAMDIFCFPSVTKNEAFGVALAEAMYFEKPAVTFTIPGSGVNYVCLSGENGIEVPNRDVEKYAAALKMLAADGDLRRRLGAVGRQRVEENFLNRQFTQSILKQVNRLAGSNTL